MASGRILQRHESKIRGWRDMEAESMGCSAPLRELERKAVGGGPMPGVA